METHFSKEQLKDKNNKPPNAKIVKHIDRCLSCYSCMTTCPSGVNYMHLIDHGRSHIEKTYKRPFNERFILSQNIKKSFDPKRILNPGKMYTGI